MEAYAFYIRCVLTGGDFEIDEWEMRLPLPKPARPIDATLGKLVGRTAEWTLHLRANGFPSEAEARAVAVPVRTAIVLAGVLLGVGIDVGSEQTVGHPPATTTAGPSGLVIGPEIGGKGSLNVWAGRPVRRLLPGDFEEAFAESYALDRPLTKRQILATQLYNQSHFHTSEAARLFTLISAVESMAERGSKSPAAVALVQRMIELTGPKSDVEEDELVALRNGLLDLRRQSISAACRALVRTHCGAPAEKSFVQAYSLRSALLHDGEPPSGTDLAAESRELDALVRLLVTRHVALIAR